MKLKIAYIIPGVKYSGGIIHVLEEAREMKKRGHEVLIFAPYRDLNRYTYYIDMHSNFRFIPGICPDLSYLPSTRHPLRLFHSLVSIRKMAYMLASFLEMDTDIVAADWYWTIFGASLSRKKGNRCKIVLKIQNPPHREIEHACGWPFSFLCRIAVSKADAIATVSDSAGRAIQDYFNRHSVNIGNGVREVFFREVQCTGDIDLLKGLDTSRKRLLYVGRLNRQKGIDILLDVMRKLKNYNIVLIIAGDGGRRYYEALARRMELSGYILWLGEISPESLPLIYQASDIFIFPSRFEGFGLPPLEAMASGTPVVLTDTEGVREYAQPGINCIMARPGDTDGLFNGVVALLKDDGLKRRLIKNARETARRFSWTRVADKAEALYNKLIERE